MQLQERSIRRRRPLHLFLIFSLAIQLKVGSSFVPQPKLLLARHPYQRIRIAGSELHYTSDSSGLESSRLLNSNSSIARNGKANDTTFAPMEEPPLADAVDSVSWTRNVYDYAKAAAGTLGDIMARGNDSVGSPSTGNLSAAVAQRDGLVTNAIPSGTLASRFGIEHPLDRMALTANGNLQRLVSSYYDAPVEVIVDYCRLMDDQDNNSLKTFSINLQNGKAQPKRWDRLVRLKVHNQTFCRAHSIITVFDPICHKLVESGEVGLGQLFRYLDLLPEFELHSAGPYPAETGGSFWREYSLKCAELSCDIHEDFASGIWDLHPTSRDPRSIHR